MQQRGRSCRQRPDERRDKRSEADMNARCQLLKETNIMCKRLRVTAGSTAVRRACARFGRGSRNI